jgi:beta-galactosidase
LVQRPARSQPIAFGLDGETLRVRNRYHTLGIDHLRFMAVHEVDGDPVTVIELAIPDIAAGTTASLSLPAEVLAASATGESWLTVRAELAAETAWAPAGHIAARAQFDLRSAERGSAAGTAEPRRKPRASSPV